ncbi:hypothetical protein [Streptomyces griseofuscus]|uniref:Uncharacterized protein n=1 Tax=Streptomyces griseofuscus TaxID=146922 RepID=A0A426RZ13_9ACTN|nr:hypothetical protein [Streptomyces griseofuscus]RRQ81531.1 hypothetical protein CQW44_30485 [Streptomyces griseofuscus]
MSVATPAPIVSPDRLLDAPLDDLLAETGVEIVDSPITDAGFFGAAVQRKSGQLRLEMPAGRSDLEHDTVARYLLAQVFDIDLPKLPAPFVTTEI